MERSFQTRRRIASSDESPPALRARVMTAAADLLATRGFAGTSISDIRKVARASASSIYHEFGSKEGILRAVLEEAADRWLAQFRETSRSAWAESARTGRPPLELCFANLANELTDRPEFLRLLVLLALERREADPHTLETIRKVRARAAAGFATAFREARLVADEVSDDLLHDIAMAALAFADGAFVAAQIDPGTTSLPRMFAIFYAGLVAALGVEGGSLPQSLAAEREASS